MNDFKLSIITPYYKTLEYTLSLASILLPQLTDEVEWIIVDDGCNELALDMLQDIVFFEEPLSYRKFNVKVIHLEKNSGGASRPRNVALDNAKGEYVVFVDSDDTVSYCYIDKILQKIKSEDFDYCYFAWSWDGKVYIIKDEPETWNKCVWNCIYKRSLIGDKRFDESMVLNEDGDFNERVRFGKKAKENIKDVLYSYIYCRPGSISGDIEKKKE